MVRLVDEKLKHKMMKDGSHLKQTRTCGGLGAAVTASGICFVVTGVLFMAMMVMAEMLSGGLVGGGIFIALGAIFIVPGYYLSKKHFNSYMAYYQKKSGYTEEVLKEFDAEFQNGEVILISNRRNLNKGAINRAGIFTTHWFKLPFMIPVRYSGLYHAEDIAAIWYQDTFVRVEGMECWKALAVLDCHGKLVFLDYDVNTTSEIVEQLVKRNPKVITSRRFSYQGIDYDVISQPTEVAALYQSIQ